MLLIPCRGQLDDRHSTPEAEPAIFARADELNARSAEILKRYS
ncbi:hypothetical protein [Streptomyces turgidiscabies]|nr:hypothetical protein [Streptomyces turgidiscabies]